MRFLPDLLPYSQMPHLAPASAAAFVLPKSPFRLAVLQIEHRLHFNSEWNMLWQAGLRPTAAAFFKFWLIILLEGTASGALGLAISAACKSVDAANAIAPACGAFRVQSHYAGASAHWCSALRTCGCKRHAVQASAGLDWCKD